MNEHYRFINITRGVALADRGEKATSIWLRLKGLLGTTNLAEGAGLLIQPCQSIHTFFMAYPIDVLFLDKELRIVHLYDSMPPYRLSRYVRRARSVIELPAGTLEKTGTRTGDLLIVQAMP